MYIYLYQLNCDEKFPKEDSNPYLSTNQDKCSYLTYYNILILQFLIIIQINIIYLIIQLRLPQGRQFGKYLSKRIVKKLNKHIFSNTIYIFLFYKYIYLEVVEVA